jgi:hypothetical protein
MKHVDMRKLPAAAQEERRRQVVGLRQSGLTYEAVAAQVSLTRTGVFNIYLPPRHRTGPGGIGQPAARPGPRHGTVARARAGGAGPRSGPPAHA